MKWTCLATKGTRPPARCNHTMTTVGKNLYIFGGRAGEDILFNDIHSFDTGRRHFPTHYPLQYHTPEHTPFHILDLKQPHSMPSYTHPCTRIHRKLYQFQLKKIPFLESNTWNCPKISGVPPVVRDFHTTRAVGPNSSVRFG